MTRREEIEAAAKDIFKDSEYPVDRKSTRLNSSHPK